MYRLTTPKHTFTIPADINTEEIDWIRWTYSQHGENVLEKTEEDVSIDGQDLYVVLTQEETKIFEADIDNDGEVLLQLRIGIGSKALVTPIHRLDVSDVLNKEVVEAKDETRSDV